MYSISESAALIRPTGIYSYFDFVQVWLKMPLTTEKVDWFRNQCGSLDIYCGPAPFGRGYRQRLQLRQPNKAALKKLLTYEDLLVNSVEASLDLIFDDTGALAYPYDFSCNYVIKKHHRLAHGINFYKRTYTGPRGVPNNLVFYDDKPCRITGEPYCLHFDYRMKNSAAVVQNGFGSVLDLINCNYRTLWERRLLMSAIDPMHLGKLHRIHFKGKSRRSEWIIPYGSTFRFFPDRCTGNTIIRACGSTQAVLDHYPNKTAVYRCLREIDVTHLLPSPSGGVYD
jgi:hypothetical protein